MTSDEIHYKLLKRLEEDPHATQRQLAEEFGVSVGKTHYALKALVERGLIKAHNFRRSDNKLGYAYILTPSGVREKARLALRFLKRKRAEYDALWAEIEALRADLPADVEEPGEERG